MLICILTEITKMVNKMQQEIFRDQSGQDQYNIQCTSSQLDPNIGRLMQNIAFANRQNGSASLLFCLYSPLTGNCWQKIITICYDLLHPSRRGGHVKLDCTRTINQHAPLSPYTNHLRLDIQ